MDTRFLAIAELEEAQSAAVVVDVMRAFTVAAWAFAQGAEKIVLAGSLDEALALKARHPDWVALKDGPPAAGFDAVNSPGLLRSVDLSDRERPGHLHGCLAFASCALFRIRCRPWRHQGLSRASVARWRAMPAVSVSWTLLSTTTSMSSSGRYMLLAV